MSESQADAYYFRIVADYIHLNPVRSGWVGGETGKRLRSWRWSSFGAYAGAKVPEWLETGRVLRAFRLSQDGRGGKAYAGYLEARAKNRKGVISDAALEQLRRGWYLGEVSFGGKVLAAIKAAVSKERKRGSVGGAAAKAHDEAEAQRLVVAALGGIGRTWRHGGADWQGTMEGGEGDGGGVGAQAYGAGEPPGGSSIVGMGHEVSVTRAVRRFREDPKAARRLKALERELGIC